MTVSEASEFTIDELARRAGMTVRNVRAYTTRGLIESPRLEGRTGYYNDSHVKRLTLIRSLLDRGFTLAAVENALGDFPNTAADLAIDLISLVDSPDTETEPQRLTRVEFEQLTGTTLTDAELQRLADLELVEVEGDSLLLLAPDVVRPGAAAIALGLSTTTILDIATMQRQHLRNIAADVVHRVSEEIVQPFIDAGLPESEQLDILQKVDAMIPIACQSVLGMFRAELRSAIETEIVDKLHDLSNDDTRSSA